MRIAATVAAWGLFATGACSSEQPCVPACRDGYVCAAGQCVSTCNPACAADQHCVEGTCVEGGAAGAGGTAGAAGVGGNAGAASTGGAASCSADDCTMFYADEDSDGWGDPSSGTCLCAPDWSHPTPFGGDCDDQNPLVSPGNAVDGCNASGPVDDDCDGVADEDATAPCEPVAIGGATPAPEELWYPLDHTVAENTYSGHVHSARDLPTSVGTTVYAAKSGTVTLVTDGCVNATAPNKCGGAGHSCVKSAQDCNCGGEYGNRITIAGFDGSITVYAHLSPGAALVHEGDVVCAGQPIGASGATGNVCSSGSGDGAHLHFEYRDPSGTYVDPKSAFTDRNVYRGSQAFSDVECQAINTLHAAGILDKDCVGHRASPTCGISRAIGATLLGKLVRVDDLASFGVCPATCDDMDSSAWYYDWVVAATRLRGQQSQTTVFDPLQTCRPTESLYRSHFLKAAIEAADLAPMTSGAPVPDIASVPSTIQPYVYAATTAGVLSASAPVRPDWVATYGWVAPILVALRQTQGSALYATDSDLVPCSGSPGTCTASSCNGHGSCNAGVCTCNLGYAGATCNMCAAGYTGYPICAQNCPPNACNGHGSCSNGTCTCNVGYTGPACGACAAGYTGYPSCCLANACGGCTMLTNQPGMACGCGGSYVCSGQNATTCQGGGTTNACGGCTMLTNQPGMACGCGGSYVCSGQNATTCQGGGTTNACGGCTMLTNQPGMACGCGGSYVCSGQNATTCQGGGTTNACGGCTMLTNQPGMACGCGGSYVCSGQDATTCQGGGTTNACGGCTTLTNQPGMACGCGGSYVCSGQNATTCQGGGTTNACGGCSTLANQPGMACSYATCKNGSYTCNGQNATTCSFSSNAPNGTTCSGGTCQNGNCQAGGGCIVVDNSDADFGTGCASGNYWWTLSGSAVSFAKNGSALYTLTNGINNQNCYAAWLFRNITSGTYNVYVRVPQPTAPPKPLAPASITYNIYPAGGSTKIPSNPVDQSFDKGTWKLMKQSVTVTANSDPITPVRVTMGDGWFGYGQYVMMVDAVAMCSGGATPP